MKVFIRMAIFVLGIGGVLYWLGTVMARPATSLWARHKAKREQLEEYGDGNETV